MMNSMKYINYKVIKTMEEEKKQNEVAQEELKVKDKFPLSLATR